MNLPGTLNKFLLGLIGRTAMMHNPYFFPYSELLKKSTGTSKDKKISKGSNSTSTTRETIIDSSLQNKGKSTEKIR